MLLSKDITTFGIHTLHGVASGAQAIALREVVAAASTRPVIMTCLSDREAETLRQQLAFFLPKAEVLFFPAWDCLPYDRVSPNVSITSQRLSTLAHLLLRKKDAKHPLILLTTVNALTQKTLPRDILSKAVVQVKKGSRLDTSALQQTLIELGYARVVKVMEAGEYAMRGNIVDVFVPGMEQGCRIDLFGDEVESIRGFDPLTQRSEGTLPEFTLQPAGEILMNQAAINAFRSNYRAAFGVPHRDDMLYEAISAGNHYPGAEHWLPLFYARLDSLLDYAPDAVVVLDTQAENSRKERLETIRDYFAARQGMDKKPGKSDGAIYHPLPPEKLYLDEYSWDRLVEKTTLIQLSPFVPEKGEKDALSLGTRQARSFVAERKEGVKVFEALKDYLRDAGKLHQPVLLASASTGTRQRFAALLAEHQIPTQMIEQFDKAGKLSDGVAALAVFPLERGLETPKLRILSEQDILGERITRTTKRKKASEYFMAEAASLAEGDLIVHRDHGIGRFEGLVTMEVEGIKRDCLKLIYADEAKLFIPVENIDIVSRYGTPSEGENVQLDRLGSASWQSRKAKLKERILLAAEELLATAAERAIHTAPTFHPQAELYGEFTRRFPYAETEDQEGAIEDVLTDLSSGKPMDRLICGDVGFGKTEVAMRAAAAVVFGETEDKRPAQVAIIAPTTLLARQHFANFSKRFEGMPVTIRQLSRLVTSTKAKETQEELRAGKVDIVIGTHAILGKSVEFNNLGLVIVDEEQHFGVAQKEKLKSLRASVHVLTLSATPIPRTLQLALSGVRELSLITTPPVDRLAVRTFVLPFDPLVLREAIQRERHRGGQVFYVTPRIADLAELQVRIRDLVPEVRLAVAHGQMPPLELDKIMTEFYEGKYDVLLSTTIVESGLDVPSANTLIINRADRFGLGQLYQLRGRVGRGKIRAYAYFTLQHQRTLAGNALRRLEVMQSLDTLGAGFTVASHDMDIRGFGNLLGEEQSGHVREVGAELYQQMLEEAVEVARRKAKKAGVKDKDITTAPETEEQWVPQINLGLSVLIPETYIADLELRMGLYRRAGLLKDDAETEEFAAELIDRFGPLPEEVQHLLAVLKTKQLCRRAGIEKLDAGPKGITLTFRTDMPLAPEALIGFIARSAGKAKLRPDNKMVILEEFRNQQEKLKGVQHSITQLAALAA